MEKEIYVFFIQNQNVNKSSMGKGLSDNVDKDFFVFVRLFKGQSWPFQAYLVVFGLFLPISKDFFNTCSKLF